MKRIAVLIVLGGMLGHASAASNEQIPQDIRVKFGELENLNKQALEQINQIKAESLKQQKALISKITEQDEQHQLQIKTLNDDLKILETKLQDSIKAHTQTVEELNQLNKSTAETTATINDSIATRTIIVLIGLLLALGLIATSYLLLRKKQAKSTEDLSSQVKLALDNVRQTEENIVKSDIQLADRLHEVLIQLKEQAKVTPVVQQNSELDHSLPLKLADEIHRMRKRLAALPEDTKGLKPLSKSLERLEDELSEQGYEIIDHTGMEFSENLSIQSRFIPSDELEQGQSIISKVVTPQVNFNGVMIRMADVEVSVG
ncbi:hypothetical protein I6L24_07585 [Acinetobacter lwoffii]|uniref:hypothetical protein n=1 Tax=Acinetobacter TaxID=469 RepID=UPI00028DCC92|nr:MULTISPECIES: hypothetical protein [Acinetobacter]QXB84708.1 hypothetical protein I6L24_07585 [Acinetobacter lwoffii]BBL21466.1 hypothetical protein ACRAD_21370 [Acinetobacter radioresistens DSM 6976 = NBRC 102413 = CIP 103788]